MHVYYISVFILLAMAVFSTLKPSPYANGAAAEDWNRHSVWVQRLIKGDFTTIYEYPPFFHLFMIPFVLLLNDSIKYFQIIFAILVIASMSYYLYKKEGKNAMILAFFLFSTSIVFQIYFFTLTPQVLDYILFPLIIMAYFNKKYFITSLGLVALMYNHLAGIAFFLVFLVYSLFYDKRYLKYLLLVVILSLPIFYIYYSWNFISFCSEITGKYFWETGQLWQTGWDLQFTGVWYKFLFYTGLAIWVLLPISLYFLIKNKFKLNDLQKFYLVWILCFLPLLFFNVWRGMSYLIIPLTILEASIIKNG